jgi:hypothetical protein
MAYLQRLLAGNPMKTIHFLTEIGGEGLFTGCPIHSALYEMGGKQYARDR